MKKCFILWCFSLALYVVDVGLLFYFMSHKSLIMLAICAAAIVVTGGLFGWSMRGITYKEGYTLIDAALFYQKCKKAGLETEKKMNASPDVIEKLTETYGFVEELTQKERQLLYRRGKSFIGEKKILK